jgi:predicted AAA+ superfamily ATPase
MIRIQKHKIITDLNKKIALLVGPRQAGKTWLAKDIAKSFSNSLYLEPVFTIRKEDLKES